MFSDIRAWLFVTSINKRSIMVECSILIPTDATPEQRQAQLQQSVAEFAAIMRHLSIGRP